MDSERFSQRLENQLNNNKSVTLSNLTGNLAEKGFAILCLILMAIPALPLPTGGITHIFEIIVMLLALELILGRRSVWLPKRWLTLKLPDKFQSSTLPTLIKLIQKIERFSKPRLSKVLGNRAFTRVIGICIFVFTLFAFLAPPFSGLDTLPALSVVLISLAVLLDDIVLSLVGLLIGIVGIALVITISHLVFKLL